MSSTSRNGLVWPDLVAAQQPPWPDAAELQAAVDELSVLPPLVFAGECDKLMLQLAAASRGEAFVLMGGDCAETFEANNAESIRARLKTVLQMSVVLQYAASLPVIKVGRLAGQYFKPRSKSHETREGVELNSYFGDAVNAIEFEPPSPKVATPICARFIPGIKTSCVTLRLVSVTSRWPATSIAPCHS
jgi:3-deoxy-7-phosphoheptulonate synthase